MVSKQNVEKKKRKVSKVTITAAVLAATVVPAIVMETTKAEASFDGSKVNVGNFTVRDVSGGVSVALTSEALQITGEVHVPKSINGKPVVSLPSYAFQNSKASAILFEDSSLITSLGDKVFQDSKATNSVSFLNIQVVPKATFSGARFSEINLDPEKITSIGVDSFRGTRTTQSISLPKITVVPDWAFSASSFTEINLNWEELTSVGMSSFAYTKVNSPINLYKLTAIPDGAFDTSLFSQINLNPDNITSIGESAFRSTVATNAMNLPNVTHISSQAFTLSKFSEINLNPEKVTSIGSYAFQGVKLNHSLKFTEITNIAEGTFYMTDVPELVFDSNKITSIGMNALPELKVVLSKDYSGDIVVTPHSIVKLESQTYTFNGVEKTFEGSVLKAESAGLYTVKLKDTAGRTVENSISITEEDISNKPEPEVTDPLEGYTAINELGSLAASSLDVLTSTDADLKVVDSKLYFKLKDIASTEFTVTDGTVSQTFKADGTLKVEEGTVPTPPETGETNPEPATPAAPGTELIQIDGGALSLNHQGATADHVVSIDLKSKREEINIPLTDKMIVTDARGTLEGWNLTVRAGRLTELPIDGAFAKDAAHTLKEGTLLLTGATVQGAQVEGLQVLNDKTAIDKDSAITIGNAGTKTGGGISTFEFDQGLMLIVDPTDIVVNNKSGVTKARYATTLNWTLTSGPTN